MTPKHLEMQPLEINGWTIRPCDEDGNDGWCLINGHERYHHTYLQVAIATAQNSKRDLDDARDEVTRHLTQMVGEGTHDPVELGRVWAHELERLGGNSKTDARRALLLQLLECVEAKREAIKHLESDLAKAEAQLSDETAPRTVDTGQLQSLKDQLARFTDTMPSWAHGQPMDYDAWLRDLIPDDNRLKFYQWIGELALREVLDELLRTLGDDPVPVEHRSYSPQDVEEMISAYHPSSGETAPSRLPMGHPFCDVAWHTHTHGGERLPSCHLDSPE